MPNTVALTTVYNTSDEPIQIIVRAIAKRAASPKSDVPFNQSRVVTVYPGQRFHIEPSRIDAADIEKYRGVLGVYLGSEQALSYLDAQFVLNEFRGHSYLENTSPVGLPNGNNARSMFGWVKPHRLANKFGLFGYGRTDDDDSRSCCMLYSNLNNANDFDFFDGLFDGGDNIARNDKIEYDEWNFIGISYENNVLAFYINGEVFQHTTSNLTTQDSVFRMARGLVIHDDITKNLFSGSISNVSVLSTSRSKNYFDKLRNLGRIGYDNLPFDILYDAVITDFSVSRNVYDVSGLTTSQGALRGRNNGEYVVGDILASEFYIGELAVSDSSVLDVHTHKNYALAGMTASPGYTFDSGLIGSSAGDLSVASKDYELEYIFTSNADTIGGATGPDGALRSRSKTMVSTDLQANFRVYNAVRSMDVFSNGVLDSLVFSSGGSIDSLVLETTGHRSLPDRSIQVYSNGSLGNLGARYPTGDIFYIDERHLSSNDVSPLLARQDSRLVVLEFVKSVPAGFVSYWDLDEERGLRYDRVGSNHLELVEV